MIDSIINEIDTIQNQIGDSIIQNEDKVLKILENENYIAEFLNDPVVFRIILPIILLILGWLLKNVYDKYFVLRPRLYLKLNRPLYSQLIKGLDIGHKLSWRYECSIKNNSKYDAYNIKILELTHKNNQDRLLSNFSELNKVFPANNHLSSNSSIEFEIRKDIHVDADVLIKFTIENGQRVIHPGIKIKNPAEKLMPKMLDDIKLVIKYENERGKTYYTKFRRRNKIETNKIKNRRPYRFKTLI